MRTLRSIIFGVTIGIFAVIAGLGMDNVNAAGKSHLGRYKFVFDKAALAKAAKAGRNEADLDHTIIELKPNGRYIMYYRNGEMTAFESKYFITGSMLTFKHPNGTF